VKFPFNASRRAIACRQRRSKNGTPEERAAARAATEPVRKQRRSKNGTPAGRAAKAAKTASVIELPRGAVPAAAKGGERRCGNDRCI
jgi:hypothetical protein